MAKQKSNCCKATIHVVTGRGGTSFYICKKCNKACDLYFKPSLRKKRTWKKFKTVNYQSFPLNQKFKIKDVAIHCMGCDQEGYCKGLPLPKLKDKECIKCKLIFPEAWGLEKHTCLPLKVSSVKKDMMIEMHKDCPPEVCLYQEPKLPEKSTVKSYGNVMLDEWVVDRFLDVSEKINEIIDYLNLINKK